MKTFTKICLLAMVVLFPAFIIAQESLVNYTGNTAPDKQELIQQLHGPTMVVPPAALGGGKAVGDDCSTPMEILEIPYLVEDETTVGRGNNYENTCLNDFDGGEDMIYELVIEEDVTLTFELDPQSTPYSGFALNEVCFDNPTTTCLAVSTDTYGTGEAHGFAIALEAGTYYIIVDSWPNSKTSSIPSFSLSIAPTTPVPNDDCANAMEISEVNNLYFNTEEATTSVWPGDYPDIFYKYTATVTGNVIIDLCDVYFDSYLFIYNGCNGSLIDFNDDADCGFYPGGFTFGLGSGLVLPVNSGDEFIIRIRGYLGDTGFGFLSIYEDFGCDELVLAPGEIPEGEACGDTINDGCNMEVPAFTSVNDGDVIFGNLWAHIDARDTDWFEISISEISNIKLSVTAEEAVTFGMIAQDTLGVSGCENMYGYFAGSKQLAPCAEDSVEFGYLPAGTYYFMVASSGFDNYDCPGFNYKAAFTVQPSAHGTISGVVDDGLNGIGGVEIDADGYKTTTAGDGTYSIDVPSGTFDVYAYGQAVGFSSDVQTGIVVDTNSVTTVNFTLSADAPTLTGIAGYSYGNLTWTAVSDKGFKGGDLIFGEITSENDYVPGTAMELEFKLVVFAPDYELVEYMGLQLPSDFTIISGSDINGVTPIVSGQDIEWNSGNLTAGVGSEILFTVNVTVAGGATGPLLAEYFVEGDESGGDPHYFSGYVTIFEEGGSYVPTYNVYRVLDDGTGNEFIPLVTNIPDTELFDVIHPGNWCYFVTQNLEDGIESARSNIVCLEILDPCENAVDYGEPGDDPQTATLEYEEQVLWYSFTNPGIGDVQISTCGSDFNTQFALYASCDDIPEYPEMVPAGAMEVFTDGCDDEGQAAGAICSLDEGTYYIAVYGENDEIGDVGLEINNDVQCLTIMDGWGGFSTYIEPSSNDSIQVVLSEMEEEMIITTRQANPLYGTNYGIWWVPEDINTIETISPLIGYKSKMDGEDTSIIFGSEIADKVVTIPAGASYLPVRVPYPTDIADIDAQLEVELLIIYNIYNAAEVFWPEGGLNTLPLLFPDYAYQINVYNNVNFDYSLAKKSSDPGVEPYTPAPFKGENIAWNDVVNTGNPHFISIQKAATDEIQIGDLLGVFNADGLCVGFTEVTSLDQNLLLNAFGDDIYTENVIDGLEEGEMMTFKLYRPSIDEEYAVEVAWNAAMPDSDGTFAVNGLSMITSFKVGSTDISESQLANVSIYPNPSTGMFNIEGLEAATTVTVSNAQGQVIFSGDVAGNGQIDMTKQPKGIYFIRLISNDEMMIHKVVLK